MKSSDYKKMIVDFLTQSVPAADFASHYQRAFLAEPGGMDKQLFEILEDLFEDVEAFSPAWSKDDEEQYPWRITEQTLRQEAAETLEKLNSYLSSTSKHSVSK